MLLSKAFHSLNKAASPSRTKENSANQTIAGQKSATLFQRISNADKIAVRECLDRHGNLVWALAKQLTDSREEAETATLEIFLDLWKCAERFDSIDCEETDFIILVARRWLLKRMWKSAFTV